MEVSSWCSSGNRDMGATYYVNTRGRYDRIDVSFNMLVRSLKSKDTTPRWRLFWRKIMKEKKKLFDCNSSSGRMHFAYDPYTYSQNFDTGSSLCSDPDNMYRSFSARFAVPARIFDKNELV